MRGFFAIAITLYMSLNVAHGHELCDEKRFDGVVARLGVVDDFDTNVLILNQLSECPVYVSKVLVKSLRVVAPSQNPGIDGVEDKDALRMTWIYRGLRYLNSCLEFQASTRYRFKRTERVRMKLLMDRGQKGSVPFLAVWMSRGTVYFAPSDAQARIIERWKKHIGAMSHSDTSEICKTVDDWYL